MERDPNTGDVLSVYLRSDDTIEVVKFLSMQSKRDNPSRPETEAEEFCAQPLPFETT